MEHFPLKRNLTALVLVKVAKWMNLVMPVIVLFYKSNGMSMQEIFTLQAVYSATLMFLEIPTGYFADFAGRRNSILMGSVLGFTGYLVYSFSSGFYEFVVAETILGLGMSLVSGADSAMLYDSLLAAGKQDSYTRYEGRITSSGNFAEALAGIAGGLLALLSLRTPFYFQAGIAFLALPAALALREPPVHGRIEKPGYRDIIRVVKLVTGGDKKLFWNTVFSAVTGTSTLAMAWFAQPWLINTGLEVSMFGVVWALLNLTVGMAAIFAWKIELFTGVRKTVLLFTGMLILSWFLLSFISGLEGIAILLLFYLGRGIATPTLRNYINIITASGIRATVLSVRNFMIRGLFVLLGPLFGRLTDVYGLPLALQTAGLIFSLLCGISLFFFLKYRTYEA